MRAFEYGKGKMKLAITGSAMLTSVGQDSQECFAAFCEGITGNRKLQCFDEQRYDNKYAYEISDRQTFAMDTSKRVTRWLCEVINESIAQAGLLPDEKRVVALIGSGLRELRSLELWWADGLPLQIEELHFGEAVREVHYSARSVFTLCNACSSSSYALGLAHDLLALDECDAVIVAGCETITESMFGMLDRVNPMSPEIIQPLDKNRKGMIMGEGAAAVILEKDNPVSRPQVWLRGVGITCDAKDQTAPSKEGIIACIGDAHERSEILPDDIDLIFIHGTGTLLNDQVELSAMSEIFGKTSHPYITGIKSNTGHTSGASGLISVVTSIECFHNGLIPPIAGLNDPIEIPENYRIVTKKTAENSINLVQVNAFGFGGLNAVVILEKPQRDHA